MSNTKHISEPLQYLEKYIEEKIESALERKLLAKSEQEFNITQQQVLIEFQIDGSSLWRRRSTNKLEYRRSGGTILYRRSDIEARYQKRKKLA